MMDCMKCSGVNFSDCGGFEDFVAAADEDAVQEAGFRVCYQSVSEVYKVGLECFY